MSIYMNIKNSVIQKYPNVIEEYEDYLNSHGNNTFFRRIRAYAHLSKLLLNKRKKVKKVCVGEYEDSKREDIDELIAKIKDYDVISFDVFDTLLFRNVEHPEDVFRIVGAEHSISGFREIRKEMETILREHGNPYYSIYDIYNEYDKINRINISEYIEKEFEIESSIVCANPYIKKLYDAAILQNKKVIAVSDMYWSKEYITKLLLKCGYSRWDNVFVSCDNKADKGSGSLYRIIRDKNYSSEKIIHFGDN